MNEWSEIFRQELPKPNYAGLLRLFRDAQSESLRRVSNHLFGSKNDVRSFDTSHLLDAARNLIQNIESVLGQEKEHKPVIFINATTDLLHCVTPEGKKISEVFVKAGYKNFCFLVNPDVKISDDEGIKRYYNLMLYIEGNERKIYHPPNISSLDVEDSPFGIWIDPRMRFGQDCLISLAQPHLFSEFSIPEVVLMQHQHQGYYNRRQLHYYDGSLRGPFWEYFKEIDRCGVPVTVYSF